MSTQILNGSVTSPILYKTSNVHFSQTLRETLDSRTIHNLALQTLHACSGCSFLFFLPTPYPLFIENVASSQV